MLYVNLSELWQFIALFQITFRSQVDTRTLHVKTITFFYPLDVPAALLIY
jgi:hypothetical protein